MKRLLGTTGRASNWQDFPINEGGKKITPLMMEGEHSGVCALGMFQETHTPAFSISIYPLYI